MSRNKMALAGYPGPCKTRLYRSYQFLYNKTCNGAQHLNWREMEVLFTNFLASDSQTVQWDYVIAVYVSWLLFYFFCVPAHLHPLPPPPPPNPSAFPVEMNCRFLLPFPCFLFLFSEETLTTNRWEIKQNQTAQIAVRPQSLPVCKSIRSHWKFCENCRAIYACTYKLVSICHSRLTHHAQLPTKIVHFCNQIQLVPFPSIHATPLAFRFLQLSGVHRTQYVLQLFTRFLRE